MQTEELTKPDDTDQREGLPPGRRRLLMAAAAAVVLIVLAVGLSLQGGNEDRPVAQPPPPTTAPPAPTTTQPADAVASADLLETAAPPAASAQDPASAAEPAASAPDPIASVTDPLAVVEAHYARWNDGDWDGYLATVHEDGLEASAAPESETKLFFEYEVALGVQIVLSNCEASESISGDVVKCLLELSNDFYAAADANPDPVEVTLVVSDGKVLLFPKFHTSSGANGIQRLGIPDALPVRAVADVGFNDWAQNVYADDFLTACGTGGYPSGFRVKCAEFRLAKVTEWVSAEASS